MKMCILDDSLFTVHADLVSPLLNWTALCNQLFCSLVPTVAYTATGCDGTVHNDKIGQVLSGPHTLPVGVPQPSSVVWCGFSCTSANCAKLCCSVVVLRLVNACAPTLPIHFGLSLCI